MIKELQEKEQRQDDELEKSAAIKMSIGKATYIIGIHFDSSTRESLDSKLRKLIMEETALEPA